MTGFSALPGASSSSSTGTWIGTARVKGPKWAQMPFLTIGMLGMQIVWSVEMGYGPPYLLSLGLSKSLMSLVFVAGPLSGFIMQPLIGVLADRSTSRFGRRRPYMLGGSLVCVGALFLLGFTKWFSGIFTTAGTKANEILTIAFAVWSIYCIDFSINAVQAADRALLVDILPPSQQEVGNAWAGRMFGLGSVAGFFVGNIDLTKILPFLGKTQLQVLCVLTGASLIGAHGMTSVSVTEKVLVSDPHQRGGQSFMHIFTDIWSNMLTLPPVILQICIIQFFSWIAWFPVLFYSTTWVGEIYTKEALASNPTLSPSSDAFLAEATRAGSRALLWSSILSFASSIILPFVVCQSSIEHRHTGDGLPGLGSGGRGREKEDWSRIREWLEGMKLHLATLWAFSHALFAISMFLTYLSTSVEAASALITLTGFSWAVTQWVPFSLLGEAILVTVPPARYDPNDDAPIPLADHRSHRPRASRTSSIRSNGSAHLADGSAAERQTLMFNADDEDDFSAPPRLPSQQQQSSKAIATGATKTPPLNGEGNTRVRSPFGIRETGSETDVDQMRLPVVSRTTSADGALSVSALERGKKADALSILSAESDEPEDGLDDDEGGDAGGGISEKAGIILGIHNIFVVVPQFLVTGLSSILFALLDSPTSVLDQGHAGHPAAGTVPSKNVTDVTSAAAAAVLDRAPLLLAREGSAAKAGGADSIGIVFRIGGISAVIACFLCWRLSRELLRGR